MKSRHHRSRSVTTLPVAGPVHVTEGGYDAGKQQYHKTPVGKIREGDWVKIGDKTYAQKMYGGAVWIERDEPGPPEGSFMLTRSEVRNLAAIESRHRRKR
jgi:hypothetical protein